MTRGNTDQAADVNHDLLARSMGWLNMVDLGEVRIVTHNRVGVATLKLTCLVCTSREGQEYSRVHLELQEIRAPRLCLLRDMTF